MKCPPLYALRRLLLLPLHLHLTFAVAFMTTALKLALLTVALRSVAASTPLRITENGVEADYYLSPTDGKTGGPNVTGSKLTLKYGERFYLMKIDKQHSSEDKGDFHLLDLVDKTINVTVDLNGASCGCNVAFYLVSMQHPGHGKRLVLRRQQRGRERVPGD